MRLARATGTGVNYWMELPLTELLAYMFELAHQLGDEQAAMERAQNKR